MQKGVITLCCAGGFFIIGSLVGEKMLRVPRIFNVSGDGKMFQLNLLPGNPEHIVLGDVSFRYPIPGAGDDIAAFYDNLLHPPDAIHTPKTSEPQPSGPAPDAATPPEVLEKSFSEE